VHDLSSQLEQEKVQHIEALVNQQLFAIKELEDLQAALEEELEAATRLGQSIPGLGNLVCRLCVPESRHRQTWRKRKSLIKRFQNSKFSQIFHR
jgi:hypothetical protein